MTKERQQFLDLLEKAVGEGLHGKAVRPLSEHGRRQVWWGPLLTWLCRRLEGFGLVLALPRVGGWPDLCDTMLPLDALRNIRTVLEMAHDEGLPGAFVECGCWRGGACVYARGVVDVLGDERMVIGCDSFEGLPRPSGADDPEDRHYTYAALAADHAAALKLPEKYGVGPVHFVKGYFKDSLPPLAPRVGPIAVLRMDGDIYSSTMDIMTSLYPLVVPGGFVIVDDWTVVPDSRRAVVDYLGQAPAVELVSSYGSAMFRKK